MWTYNYTNELYHYGVKGMKWGHRKSSSKSLSTRASKHMTKRRNKRRAAKKVKEERRQKQVRKTTDRFGVGGVAISSYVNYKRKKRAKSYVAHLVNSMANAYIRNSEGSYAMKVGVDYVRKAAIMSLSVGNIYDQAEAVRNVVDARKYRREKRGI